MRVRHFKWRPGMEFWHGEPPARGTYERMAIEPEGGIVLAEGCILGPEDVIHPITSHNGGRISEPGPIDLDLIATAAPKPRAERLAPRLCAQLMSDGDICGVEFLPQQSNARYCPAHARTREYSRMRQIASEMATIRRAGKNILEYLAQQPETRRENPPEIVPAVETETVMETKQQETETMRKITATCEDCNAEYAKTSNVQKYCPDCGKKRREQRNMKYRQARGVKPRGIKKSQAKGVPVGAMITCEKCGVEIAKQAGGQKYCPACRKLVMQDHRRAYREKHRAGEAVVVQEPAWFADHRDADIAVTPEVEPPTAVSEAPTDSAADLAMFLSLVLEMPDMDGAIDEISTWSAEERERASDWAAREHLIASDHDELDPLPAPACVAALALHQAAQTEQAASEPEPAPVPTRKRAELTDIISMIVGMAAGRRVLIAIIE